VGIVAASLPALRPLFAAFYDKTLKYTYGAASRTGYGQSNGYAQGYGQGNDRYLRQKNTVDDDVTKSGITLRSYHEREAFAGKRDAARIHTTQVTSKGRKGEKSISQADDLSGGGSGNDYDSDEIILHQSNSESQMGPYRHGVVQQVAPPQGIMKTTTVHIARR